MALIYAMSCVNLGRDGPIVFEAPPQMQGILLDFWQRPIPADGGKYLGDVGLFAPDPLNNKNGAKAMKFPDGSGVSVNMLPRSDASAFDQRKTPIDSEPCTIASPDWLGVLATLGIIKGHAFNPDSKTRHPRQRRKDWIQDEPRRRFSGQGLADVPTSSIPIAIGSIPLPTLRQTIPRAPIPAWTW